MIWRGQGKEVDLAPRPVRLDSAKLLAFDGQVAEIELQVGKGFYVRSFARDLGESLRSKAHMSGLVRTQVGPFTLKDAISLDSLTASGEKPRHRGSTAPGNVCWTTSRPST